MADITLHDGREITVDAYAITHGEFSRIMARTSSDEEDEKIIAKACGLTPEDVAELPEKDWREIVRTVLKKVSSPDPN